ncbi:sodium:solute symporter family protein [Bauldia sp.]|uniref:sodium:solute symporter family protein n=1 Tax=Bauldia sp. TaxID=2575872 RepID=UPI003BA88C9E
MIDTIVVAIYLLVIVGVGLWVARGQTNLADYAVAGRSFGPLIIFATMSASFIGGGFSTGNSANVFLFGIAGIVGLWGFSLKEILVATLVAPKLARFPNAISVGDIMAEAYGKVGRIVTGLAGLFLCTGIVGAQVGAMGIVFNVFFGIDRIWGVAIGCGIVILYTTFGGMRAVVATDVIQFVVLAIGMPLVLYFGLQYVGGIDALIAAVPADHIAIPGHHYGWVGLIALILTFLFGETLVPPYVQRLLSGRDTRQAARGTMLSGLFSIPFFAVTGLIGLVALAIDPDLDSNLAMPHVIVTVMPPILQGLVVAAVIAIVMSSADSFLNSASIAFINDVLQPLRARPVSQRESLTLARVVTFVVGLMSIIFAVTIDGILNILIYAYTYWAPVVLVPLIATIYGYRKGTTAFLAGALAGVFAGTFWDNLLEAPGGVAGLVIGVFVNFVVFSVMPSTVNMRPDPALD